jgi:P-type Ca2+ transporter type 2C
LRQPALRKWVPSLLYRRRGDTELAALPSEAPAVEAIHAVVPGRLRLSVSGLLRNPDLKRPVEETLCGLPATHGVSANPNTGNALILYDPAHWQLPDLLEAADRALKERREYAARHNNGSRSRAAGTGTATTNASPTDAATSHPVPPPRSADNASPLWHSTPNSEVARLLGADPASGLSEEEASRRRRVFGPNRLPVPEEPSLLSTVIKQYLNAPTALLAVGAALSLLTGAAVDALLIGGVIVANGIIGAMTERSGQSAIAALRRVVPIRARVERRGETTAVDASELVPGDVIQLLPGDPVPADGRLWEAHRLHLEESALTGESVPVEKTAAPSDPDAPLADRRSMVYRGTTVVGGRGRAIVVATGTDTAVGQLHGLAAEAVAPPTPLKRDLDNLGRVLAISAGGISLAVMGISLLRGVPPARALATAVALGVAALPEGLPTTATTVLALGSGRMRRKGTLIRSLNAAEALGSVTLVCADKTGTLTENRMSVGEIRVGGVPIHVSGTANSPIGRLYSSSGPVRTEDNRALSELLRVAVLCSDAEVAGRQNGDIAIDGSATEGSLLILAMKAGLDVDRLRAAFPRLDRRDRVEGRRHMVTVHAGPRGPVALAKGAPDEIVEICRDILRDGEALPLSPTIRDECLTENAEMASRAMRVLAFASRPLPSHYTDADLSSGFTWTGLVGLVDPIRPGVPEAIEALRGAGIKTIMVTGDQATTAAAVAHQLGLDKAGPLHVLEAGDLAAMDEEVLRGLVRHVEVFARVPPEMKLKVVRALQAGGEVVAMTGDGINDAPALRAADVGIAMGERGSELARELADVVLSTDDFTKVVDAVEEGRLVRTNVRRVLHYLLSTNASEVWAVIAAVLAGLPAPLTPGQLLWLNLITDLAPAIGLSMESRDPELMHRPPRPPAEPIVPAPLQRRIVGESAAIAVGSLAAYATAIRRHGTGPIAQTAAFSSLATAQLLHVGLARAGAHPAIGYGRAWSAPLLLGVGSSALLQAAALLVRPLRTLIGGAPLGLLDGAMSLITALLPIMGIELQRRMTARLSPTGDGSIDDTARGYHVSETLLHL